MSEETNCACSTAPRLIFACSGAADVGAIADQAARRMTREGIGQMFCLAGIGGRISGIMKSAEASAAMLAIGGCPINCAKHCLEQAHFNRFAHVQLADLGMEKGKTPVSDENIARVAAAGTEALTQYYQA
ncbi:MAG TPA: zinc-binding protein [Candidatus Hydrogenedentes bacterium]|nr:zinc-binding protein [Candidatus Hydrogenedentota bacterium]